MYNTKIGNDKKIYIYGQTLLLMLGPSNRYSCFWSGVFPDFPILLNYLMAINLQLTPNPTYCTCAEVELLKLRKA